jgi:hypothetical protein
MAPSRAVSNEIDDARWHRKFSRYVDRTQTIRKQLLNPSRLTIGQESIWMVLPNARPSLCSAITYVVALGAREKVPGIDADHHITFVKHEFPLWHLTFVNDVARDVGANHAKIVFLS